MNHVANTTMGRSTRPQASSGNGAYAHRTAKVVELIGTSTKSFEEAIQNCLTDASTSTRGITGAHVENFSVRCENGQVCEYKVNLKVAFGIERTPNP